MTAQRPTCRTTTATDRRRCDVASRPCKIKRLPGPLYASITTVSINHKLYFERARGGLMTPPTLPQDAAMTRRHLNGDGRRARIGIVVPSVNTVMEPWAQKVVPDGVSIFAARMFIPPATTPEAFVEMDRNEGKAAIRQLSSVHPDAIAYGCTASSIV